MTGLLGPDGTPAQEYVQRQASFNNKKAPPPKLGESFGNWAGRSQGEMLQLPGGGIIQFDLSKLMVQDFRGMRDHYQVNASLAILTFMQHQSDWHIECEDKRIRDHVTEELERMWTQLNRSMSTANWAGYSPNVLQWENDTSGRRVLLDKVKDLPPEECEVNWKLVPGWSPPDRTPPKFKVYDGFKQVGQPWPVPVESTLWYPMLMEHGDYYGRKLLRPAFTSWFFSILVHLFANRYYERFGEPVPVGRAPNDAEVNVGTVENPVHVTGTQFMADTIQKLRSRSVVVLPDDRSDSGNGTQSFDYTLEYLESQMRGADFERYMTRLDEEISIGLFTPILMLRTADVGSYNLGQGHERTYQVMLNSMNDDRKLYIDKYVISKMIDYNFGTNAPRARIRFRKLGQTDTALLKELLLALINKDKIKVDITELGQATGMSIEEIRESTTEPPKPGEGDDDDADTGEDGEPTPNASIATRAVSESHAVAKEIVNRVRGQVEAAFRAGQFPKELNLGFKNKMEKAVARDGAMFPIAATAQLYENMDKWSADVTGSMSPNDWDSPDEFMSVFNTVLHRELANASGL